MDLVVSYLAGKSLLIWLAVPVLLLIRKFRPVHVTVWGVLAGIILCPMGTGMRVPWTAVFAAVWIAGMMLFALCSAVSYCRICKRYAKSVSLGDNIYLCDYVPSGCILGYRRPRIYLNASLCSKDAANVLAHERMHLKRGDHWWKLLGYGLLVVYWFHPLVWAAYHYFCRDMELACDEDLTWMMDTEQKQSYARTLLNCCRSRSDVGVSAFSDIGAAERIAAICGKEKAHGGAK